MLTLSGIDCGDRSAWPSAIRLPNGHEVSIEITEDVIGWSSPGFYCSVRMPRHAGRGPKQRTPYWVNCDCDGRPEEVKVTASASFLKNALKTLHRNLDDWLEVPDDHISYLWPNKR